MSENNHITDSLSKSEIKKRSISGAKWLVVMSGISMPASFLIALMLGRIDASALGIYALIQILVGVITTFIVYGGQPVLSVFLPKISSSEDRGRFLFSYFVILFVFMTLMLGLFRIFPDILEFLLQREFDMRNYSWFVMLTIVIVSAETFANAAAGLMLIKITAIARKMTRFVLLPVVGGLFIFNPEFLVEYGMSCILGGFLVGYLAAIIICVVGISREKRLSMRFGWFLPSGFWAFSGVAMTSTVFAFLYGNIDRIAVLSIQDVAGLGIYQAVLSVNAFIERVPILIKPSLLPTFSHLLVADDEKAFRGAFALLSRWATVPVTIASLVTMGFSYQIMGLFGEAYVNYYYLLTLFGLVGIIRSLNLPTSIINTSMEKNRFRFCQQSGMISLQFILTFILISRYGVFGIASARMVSVSIASLSGVFYVFYALRIMQKIPLTYKSAVLTGIIMTVLRIRIVPTGWAESSFLTVCCLLLFITLSRFSKDEIMRIFTLIRYQDANLLKTKEENR